MKRRVIGIETEYGLTCATRSGARAIHDADAAAHLLFSPFAQGGRAPNLYLRNGGRLYLDVGAHPEYATAECDTLLDLLAQHRCGDELLNQLNDAARSSLSQLPDPEEIYLFRNNVDSEGNSFGCHENYLLHRRRDFRQVADGLVAFFVTRLILVGAGHLRRQGTQLHYCFSQRAEQMWEAVSSATTRTRPIINTRDEPLADAGQYRRLHVISGDTNVCEATTFLKVGMTALVLDAVEEGMDLKDLELADPMMAIRQINHDLSGQTKIAMVSGPDLSAVEIQERILQRVIDVLKIDRTSDSLEPTTHAIIDLWQRGIHALRSQDWSGIDHELDFAVKYRLIREYLKRKQTTLDDPRVARLLLSYHDIGPHGLRQGLERTGAMRRMTTDDQVKNACVNAPQTTRAHLRSKVINAAEAAGVELALDWVRAARIDDPNRYVLMNDPFATASFAVDEFISGLGSPHEVFPA